MAHGNCFQTPSTTIAVVFRRWLDGKTCLSASEERPSPSPSGLSGMTENVIVISTYSYELPFLAGHHDSRQICIIAAKQTGTQAQFRVQGTTHASKQARC